MAESRKEKNDAETELTMLDVLEEEEELEEDAKAVLGDSDDQNCTYFQGYSKRQALYACATCITSDMDPAGICLACSYACHENHDLYELYTKRNFRCDCGNSKFPGNSCTLYPNKEPCNSDNKYNHNFGGKYCICERPYPDAEDDIPDEMIQCIMCEDWYHGRHLGGTLPDNSDYSEMICAECMKSHPFLSAYYSQYSNSIKSDNSEATEVDESGQETESKTSHAVESVQSGDTEKSNNGVVKEEPSEHIDVETNDKCDDESKTKEKLDKDVSDTSINNNTCQGLSGSLKQDCETDKDVCLLKNFQKSNAVYKTGPSFWPDSWRLKLCRCSDCLELYKEKNCLYILDEDDTIHAYEERGKVKPGGRSQYDNGWSAFQRLDRIQQVEAIHEYNAMKTALKEYLKKFVDSKKIVREEDIREFFSQMQSRKRQRTESHIPHFCR